MSLAGSRHGLDARRPDVAAAPPPARRDRQGPRAGPQARRTTVLLVEDDLLTAMTMAEALTLSGYEVIGPTAEEAEALRLAAAEPPAYAVVDIKLGAGGNGLNIGRALTRQGVTVVYASGQAASFRQEMEDSGARACLHKPFSVNDVPGALTALEQLHRGERPREWPAGFHLFVD